MSADAIRKCVREIELADMVLHDLIESHRINAHMTAADPDTVTAIMKRRNDATDELAKLLATVAPARVVAGCEFFANTEGDVTFDIFDQREEFREARCIGYVVQGPAHALRLRIHDQMPGRCPRTRAEAEHEARAAGLVQCNVCGCIEGSVIGSVCSSDALCSRCLYEFHQKLVGR